MNVTRKPEHEEYTGLGAWNIPGEDYLLLVDGNVIGSTYWCGADYIADGQRWASWGPAGLSMGHRTREDAERAQVQAYAINPDAFDRLTEIHEREQAAEAEVREAEYAAQAAEREATRRIARLGSDEPGTTTFTIPAYHVFYAEMAEVDAVSAWLEANSVDDVSAVHDIRVEQRATRQAFVFERPMLPGGGRGAVTETHVVTLTAAPAFPEPAARPDMPEVIDEHWPSRFPLLDYGQSMACATTGSPIGETVPPGSLLEDTFVVFVDHGIGSTITYPSFYTRMNRVYTWGCHEGRTAAEVVVKLREVAKEISA